MRITNQWLIDNGACEGHRQRFMQLYPGGQAELSLADIRNALKHNLDVYWVVQHFINHVRRKGITTRIRDNFYRNLTKALNKASNAYNRSYNRLIYAAPNLSYAQLQRRQAKMRAKHRDAEAQAYMKVFRRFK